MMELDHVTDDCTSPLACASYVLGISLAKDYIFGFKARVQQHRDYRTSTMLSYKVFMAFTKTNGDATQVVEKDCYEMWVKTRRKPPMNPTESFRRVLTAHVCGLGGRKPFPKKVEESLLVIIRKKRIWPCFKDTGFTIGIRGFRKIGFHEKQRNLMHCKKPKIKQLNMTKAIAYDEVMYALAQELIRLQNIEYLLSS